MTKMLISEDQRDCLQEIANVAMGQSADRLARLLEVFVVLSIPNVSILNPTDISMTLQSLGNEDPNAEGDSLTGVCQGFIGGGIAGETMLIFNGTDYDELAQLLKYAPSDDKGTRNELLMDTANVLNGACLRSFAEQLDSQFSLGSPALLGEYLDINALLKKRDVSWENALVIEINYTIQDHKINCDLLIVITENSIHGLLEKLNYLLD